MQAIAELNVGESFGPQVRERICEWPDEDPCRYELRAEISAKGKKQKQRRYAVQAAYIQHQLALLERARVPASPPLSCGLDGATYELSLWRGMNSVSYTWWLSPPCTYGPLIEFSNQLLKSAQLDHRIALCDGAVK